MNKFLLLPLALTCMMWMGSCNDAPSSNKQTILTGKTLVLVDESVEPIIRDQLEVFLHSYEHAEITLSAKPENQVINDLVQQQGEIAILTRLLSPEEQKFFDERGFKPRVTTIAKDAVVLIANRAQSDTSISVSEVLDMMRGQGQRAMVFENANSSTFRYFRDLAKVDTLPSSGVYALKSTQEVVQYVADHPNSVGVLGLSWVLRPDSAVRSNLEKIRILSVEVTGAEGIEDGVYAPNQSNLATQSYPFVRAVHVINAEPRQGLGIGFAAFMGGDRGQRIMLKSGLMPDSLPPRELIWRK